MSAPEDASPIDQPSMPTEHGATAPEPPLDVERALWQLRILTCWLGLGLLAMSLAFNAFVWKQNRNLLADRFSNSAGGPNPKQSTAVTSAHRRIGAVQPRQPRVDGDLQTIWLRDQVSACLWCAVLFCSHSELTCVGSGLVAGAAMLVFSGSTCCKACSASSAAAASACFLLQPCPRPIADPSHSTTASKYLLWSGPDSSTTRYTGVAADRAWRSSWRRPFGF